MQTHHADSTISLLYVEDDPCTREIVTSTIASQHPGMVLHAAKDGEAGLALFKRHRPDIVLTDISMPVMDGMQMAFNIRSIDPSANIIAVTAKDETRYLLDAIDAGVSRYLLKPLQFGKLFDAIDECVARVALQRQARVHEYFSRQLSRSVEQGPSMVMITSANGVIQYVNPKFSTVTGYSPDEVLGQNLLVTLRNITASHDLDLLWSAVRRGAEWRGEFMSRKKNGELYFKKVCVSPLIDDQGSVTQLVAVMEDVTERKEMQEKMRRLNDELEQRVKERTKEMEAANCELETFCYSVAHDLSTPLRGMSCFSSILLEDYQGQLDDTGKEYLKRIESASVRMGQLINDLLKLSRVTRGNLSRKRIDLSALAQEVLDSLRACDPARSVEMVVARGIEADGDPGLVRMAVENLLENAWKFTGKESSPKIEFGSCRRDGETTYFVRDNGIGFDMAYAPKIFIPFERLHGMGEFEGTGVGLATVQRIVTRHGGRVWAEGEEGKGSTFYFTLGARRRH